MALHFCEHDDVVFDDAPLIRVLCQVRFPPVLSLLTIAGVTGFQTALRERYPTMLPPEGSAKIDVKRDKVEVENQAPVWKFRDDAGQWTVGIAVNFVSLETPSYTHIDEFLQRFGEILTVLRRTIRPADSLRIGLRKVNMFKVGGKDSSALAGIVRPELLGPIGAETYPAPITGYFSQLVFEDDDNVLVVRHGLADPGDDAVTADDTTNFVLDMDYFTERPHEVDGGDALVQLMRYFSDGMTSFFHWAVEEPYKLSIGPHERSAARGVE